MEGKKNRKQQTKRKTQEKHNDTLANKSWVVLLVYHCPKDMHAQTPLNQTFSRYKIMWNTKWMWREELYYHKR